MKLYKKKEYATRLISLLFCFSLPLFAQETPTFLPPGYAVTSEHPLATNAGLEVLAKGGNAFDAAVAVSAALAVVAPYHSGIGGGGFWLLHQESTHKNVFVDGREVAPMAATKNMYLDSNGKIIPNLSLNGGLAAAIPGEPAALVYIAKHYGRLPLSKNLAPAIQLAEKGFTVDKQLNSYLRNEDRLEQIKKYKATAAVFLKEGRPYEIGEQLRQPDLAKTLKLIAQEGKKGFYSGDVAKHLVDGVNAAGGIWTLKDLAQYRIKIREPLVGAYHNMLVITAPPPSAGGISLLTMLNILSHYPLTSMSKIEWIHYIVESMRLAYWQRDQFLGDPDFIKIPITKLISAANAKRLRTLINPQKAGSSRLLQEMKPALSNRQESKHTTHFTVIDKEGNRVSATLTVNFIFGSSVVAGGTGVLLNDEMEDFSAKVDVKNVFGIIGSAKNSIAPGKRPLSTMTPTFLELPKRVALVGTPGGSRIATMVLLASLAFYEGYGAISMVSGMRFHHQYVPDMLQFEPDTFPASLQEALKKMGYHLMPLKQYYGDMQAITWDQEEELLTAASDPRGIGLGAVIGKPPEYGVKH